MMEQQENRKKPATSSRGCHQWCRFVVDLLLFYTTAFFVLLAVFSLFALVFLVPFFIDPAWSTLQADFDPQGTQCRTISGQYLEGRSVCDWSSCQEGCTKTVYTCWKIIVEYELPGVNPGSQMKMPTAEGKLFPNVKGCGYPPSVDCNEFLKTYGKNGTNFTCFVARSDPQLVIVNLDLQEVKTHLFYSLAVPFPCLFVSLCYLVLAYKFIYNESSSKSSEKDAYKPVASMAAGSAFAAAFIDLRDSSSNVAAAASSTEFLPTAAAAASSGCQEDQESEKERQKRFLLQIQRTKWLAQHGKLAKDNMATAGALGVDLAKSVRMKELKVGKAEVGESYLERIKKDRSTYSSDKHKILNYYQYYNVNG